MDELDELDGYLGDEDPLMTKLLDMVPKKPKIELTHKISVKRKLKRVERRKEEKEKKWYGFISNSRWFKWWFRGLLSVLTKMYLGFHPTN